MRAIILLLLSVCIFSSCGGSVQRTVFGTTEKNLVKTVSIEQNCPIGDIKIIDKVKGLHGATYALEVCGKRIVYKQIGSVFMEASAADKLVDELQKKQG